MSTISSHNTWGDFFVVNSGFSLIVDADGNYLATAVSSVKFFLHCKVFYLVYSG